MNYRERPGLSGSVIGLLECPAKYRWHMDNPEPPTDSMVLGSLRHAMLLEPHRVEEMFYKLPETLTRRAGKDYEALVTLADGKPTIKHDDWVEAEAMVKACAQHPQVRPILEARCVMEHEMYWGLDGVACKGKADLWLPDLNVLVDYKTTNDASPSKFKWTLKDMGYLLQLAHYQRGLQITEELETLPGVLVIAQEYSAPYVTQVYSVPQAMLDEAHARYRELLGVYKQCISTGIWPGYAEGIIDL